MSLADIVLATEGQLKNKGVVDDSLVIDRVTTDSRDVRPGDLFIALRGEHFDGHKFIAQAQAKGAVACIADREVVDSLPTVCTTDTTLALGRLAASWRARFELPVVGITGSNGKTTVKQMLGAILSANGHAGVVTEGNLNNHIGVPLTLLRLSEASRYCVVEMGMNHLGEIDYLSRLVKPEVAVITNASAAHLHGVGDINAVASAKGEIFSGLSVDGTAILNQDDQFAQYWRGLVTSNPVLYFGLNVGADVTAEYRLAPQHTDLVLFTPSGRLSVTLPVPGLHNVYNAMAATAAAIALGVDGARIARGLETFESAPGRLRFTAAPNGARMIDDTYNANPASMFAAIDVLTEQPGRHVGVFGDMAELGEQGEQGHRDVLAYAHNKGVRHILTFGPQQRRAGLSLDIGVRAFEDIDQLVAACLASCEPGTTLLIKGSRSMRMERVVQALADANPNSNDSNHENHVANRQAGPGEEAAC